MLATLLFAAFHSTLAQGIVYVKGSSSTGIPIECKANIVFVKVSINGAEPRMFFLDTGFGATVIDTVLASKLGLRAKGNVRVDGSGGASSASELEPVDVALPGLKAHLGTCIATSLQTLRSQTGIDIQGILGSDFVGQCIAQIDYQRQKLNIFDGKGFVAPRGAAIIPIRIDQVPLAMLTITTSAGETIKGTFMLDTGSDSGLNLFRKFVEANHVIGPKDKTLSTASMGVANESKNLIMRLRSITFGGQTLSRVTSQVSLDEADGACKRNWPER